MGNKNTHRVSKYDYTDSILDCAYYIPYQGSTQRRLYFRVESYQNRVMCELLVHAFNEVIKNYIEQNPTEKNEYESYVSSNYGRNLVRFENNYVFLEKHNYFQKNLKLDLTISHEKKGITDDKKTLQNKFFEILKAHDIDADFTGEGNFTFNWPADVTSLASYKIYQKQLIERQMYITNISECAFQNYTKMQAFLNTYPNELLEDIKYGKNAGITQEINGGWSFNLEINPRILKLITESTEHHFKVDDKGNLLLPVTDLKRHDFDRHLQNFKETIKDLKDRSQPIVDKIKSLLKTWGVSPDIPHLINMNNHTYLVVIFKTPELMPLFKQSLKTALILNDSEYYDSLLSQEKNSLLIPLNIILNHNQKIVQDYIQDTFNDVARKLTNGQRKLELYKEEGNLSYRIPNKKKQGIRAKTRFKIKFS